MKTEILKITPEIAKLYLQKNVSNRKINDDIVNYYADQMRRLQWMMTGQGISFDLNGNLIDGQHRLAAVIKANMAVHMLCIFDIHPDAFQVYDTGKKRNASDTLYIEGIKNSRTIAAAINTYFNMKKGYMGEGRSIVSTKTTNTDVLYEYNEQPDFWQGLYLLSSRIYRKNKLITESLVLGISAYLILEKHHEFKKVESFWNQFAGFENTENSIIDMLRDTLIRNLTGRTKLKYKNKLALIYKTWNYFITKQQRKVLVWSEITDQFPTLI